METLENAKFTWIDIPKPTEHILDSLALKYPFYQLNLDDCLSTIQLSKIDKHETHSFIILRFPLVNNDNVNNNEINKRIVTVNQLSVFIGAKYLVTIHQGTIDSLSKLFQSCKKDGRLREISMGGSPAYLLYKIIDGMVDELLSDLILIERNLDIIEDAVFDGKVSESMQIASLRRQITTLRRMVIPLRRVISEMAVEVRRFSDNHDLVPYYSDVLDHIDKVLEEIEASKETIEIYKDVDFTNQNQKSNKILGLLTILFTLTIPVTVISSFYGMNIEIPGSVQSGPSTFLGPYTNMITIIVASIVPSLIMLWYFYHKNWMTF